MVQHAIMVDGEMQIVEMTVEEEAAHRSVQTKVASEAPSLMERHERKQKALAIVQERAKEDPTVAALLELLG